MESFAASLSLWKGVLRPSRKMLSKIITEYRAMPNYSCYFTWLIIFENELKLSKLVKQFDWLWTGGINFIFPPFWAVNIEFDGKIDVGDDEQATGAIDEVSVPLGKIMLDTLRTLGLTFRGPRSCCTANMFFKKQKWNS